MRGVAKIPFNLNKMIHADVFLLT